MAVRYELSRDSGVSESIGFLLIFAIIITGIALVTLYGYPLLLQQQVSADEKIMEKNMIVLQNDIKSLAYKTVPYKETSLKISGGSLTVYDSSLAHSPTIEISYPNCPITPSSPCEPFKSGELRYESIEAQTDISLQNGAVVMRPRIQQGSTMLAEPRWIIGKQPGSNTVVITLIDITSDSIMAKEGIGTVKMALFGDPLVYPYTSSPTQLSVKFAEDSDPKYHVAWENYFESLGMRKSGDSYIFDDVDKLYIKKYIIQIKGI
jgi:hypothetical protein